MKHDEPLAPAPIAARKLAGRRNISRTKFAARETRRPVMTRKTLKIRALGSGDLAAGVVGPVAIQSGDAPFDALAETGKSAILDDRIMYVAQLAVAYHHVAATVPTRNIVGLPGPKRDLVDIAIGGDGQAGIPVGAFLFLELRGDGWQRRLARCHPAVILRAREPEIHLERIGRLGRRPKCKQAQHDAQRRAE